MSRVKFEDRNTVRSEMLGISATKPEKEQIQRLAFNAKLSVSQYLRNLVFKPAPRGKLFKDDIEREVI